jgi:hypothetical protein
VKKRIGIITIISYNYGNRLQNYALCKVLGDLGYKVYTLPTKKNYKLKKIIAWMVKPFWGKDNNWERFEKRIPYGNKTYDKIDIEKYDYFIAGSDQIWNPYFQSNSKREFLFFARPEQRISYAASFGVSEYPKEKELDYGKELAEFKAISVREATGIDIVKKMSGRTCELVLDPVLLLSSYEWDQVIGNKTYTGKPYIVLYFLGKMNNPCIEELLQQASKKGFETMDVLKMNKSKKGSIGPEEFVRLIRNASFVITDSFHATVFSVLFHRPFVTINRSADKNAGDMSSRLASLLEQLGMQKRFVSTSEDLDYDCFSCDYSDVDEKINSAKEKSMSFLKKALE